MLLISVDMFLEKHFNLATVVVLVLFVGLGACVTSAVPTGDAVPFNRHTVDSNPATNNNLSVKIVGDLDGDGFLDGITAGERDSDIVWYKYPNWTKYIIYKGVDAYVDGEVADIDDDGDMDIVLPDNTGGTKLVWFKNPLPDGDPTQCCWDRVVIGATDYAHDMEVADMDSDRKLDVIKRGGNLVIFYQNTPNSWQSRDLGDAGEGFGIGDIDNDGFPDLSEGSNWLANPGNRTDLWQIYNIGDPGDGWEQVIVDVNGDSRADIIKANLHNKNALYWYEGPPDPRNNSWPRRKVGDNVCSHTLNVGDVNLDNSMDIIVGCEGGEIAYFANNGSDPPVWTPYIVDSQSVHNMRVGDFGNDGDLDFFGSNFHNGDPLHFWENQLHLPSSATDPPTDGLQIWFRADAGIEQTSGLVSRWVDQSANGLDAVQNDDAHKPIYIPNGLNGLPVVRFDASKENQLDFGPWDPDGLTKMTLAIVSANTDYQCHPQYGCENSIENHGTLFAPLSWQEDGSWGTTYLTPMQETVSVRFGTGEADNVHVYQRPQSIEDAFSYTVAVHDDTTEYLYINGELVEEYNVGNATLSNNVSSGWLGRGRADTWFEGEIAEVLVYTSAITDDDLEQLNSYLKEKYFNIASSTFLPIVAKEDVRKGVNGQVARVFCP